MVLTSLFGKPIFFLVVLLCGIGTDAFSPLMTQLGSVSARTHGSKVGPLWYRELDGDDDEMDPAMLKVQSRAPLGYDVKKALQDRDQMSGKQPPKNAVN